MLGTPPRPAWTARSLQWIVVVALMLFVAGLGTLRLGERSIWLDEGLSIWYALHTWSALLDRIATVDPNMSLYYGLLWFWRHLFGSGVFAMRGLSVVFAALTVPAVYVLGRRVFDARAGLIAATLMAVNGFLLTYAQEARSYALVAFLVTVSSYFFFAQLTSPTTANGAGYVVASALAFYAHFFAAFVILSHVAYLLATRHGDALRRRWIAEYAGIVLLVLPIVYPAVTLRESNVGWQPKPGWSMFSETLRTLAGGTNGLRAAYVAVGIIGIALAVRTRELRRPLAFPAMWLLVPVALTFAISQASPILLSKYLIVSLPALAILAGGVLANLRRVVAGALVIAIIGLSIPALRSWYSRPSVTNWKAVTSYVLAHTHRGDGVLLYSVTYPYEYYAARSTQYAPERIAAIDLKTLGSVRNPRVWLVFANANGASTWVPAELRRHGYTRLQRRSFGEDLLVELLTRGEK